MKPAISAALWLACSVSLGAQVTYDRLLHSDKEPQNWLTYSGGYGSQQEENPGGGGGPRH